MMRIQLREADIYTGDLLLVSFPYPLRQDITELVPVDNAHPEVLLQPQAQRALAMTLDVLASGDRIVPVSGFRSHGEQTALYADCLKDHGPEYTARYVAQPGCSEHETGLAIDLGENRAEIDFIAPEFPYTGVCQEFRLLAPQFGLVQRYEAGKEDVTGIGEEPWHFRYVGCPHSEIMAKQGLNLEEYLLWVRQFTQDAPLRHGGAAVFYTPFQDHWQLELPDDGEVTVSGNNVDGCVVTIWEAVP